MSLCRGVYLTLLMTAVLAGCHPGTHKAKQMRARCQAGDAKACHTFAEKLSRGEYVLRDEAGAAVHFEHACKGGIADACAQLGALVHKGRGLPAPDTTRAARLYEQACERGATTGCTQLALLHLNGAGVRKDANRAAALLEKGCAGGDVTGCSELGRLYLVGEGVSEDFTRAAALLEGACDKKVMPACVRLGRLYMEGAGLQQDEKRAIELFRSGCIMDGRDDDVGEGCFYLSRAFISGRAVAHDVDSAAYYTRRACRLGYREACPPGTRFE